MASEELKSRLFDLSLFFLTAARGCVDEPQIYGPLRLVDGLSRVLELQDLIGVHDDFLTELKKEIDEKKYVVMASEEKFIAFIDDLIKKSVKELKKRKIASKP